MTPSKPAKPSKTKSDPVSPDPAPTAAMIPLATTPPPGQLVEHGMSDAARAFLDEAEGPRERPSNIPIISINHKEGKFLLPSGDLTEEVSGYPVYYFHTRRWYEKPPRSGEPGKPPDCWSADCITPHRDSVLVQASACADCPQNGWGTARDGRGKACGTYTWVFLLNPAFGPIPLGVVVAPPSSLRPLVGTKFDAGYFARAIAKHGTYELVWTTLGLETRGDQVEYCVLEPRMGESVTDMDKARKIAAVRNQFLKMMEDIRGVTGQKVVGAETP